MVKNNFLTHRSRQNNKYYFSLYNGEGKRVLQSEGYRDRERVDGAISLVRENYSRGVSSRRNRNGRFYYVLRDQHGNVLGRCPGRRSFRTEADAISFGNSAVLEAVRVDHIGEPEEQERDAPTPSTERVSTWQRIRNIFRL